MSGLATVQQWRRGQGHPLGTWAHPRPFTVEGRQALLEKFLIFMIFDFMFSTQNNRKTSEATLRSVISSYCCLSNLNTTSPAPKPRKCPRIPPHPGFSEPTGGSVRLSMISCDFLTSAGTSCGLEIFQGAGDIQNLTEVPRITVDASNFRSCT